MLRRGGNSYGCVNVRIILIFVNLNPTQIINMSIFVNLNPIYLLFILNRSI